MNTRWFLGLLTAMACGLLAETALGRDGEWCRQLVSFSKDLQGRETREVTLFSEWGAEPVKGCEHDPADPIASAFCAWLFDNSSTEFMEVNVRGALSCLTGESGRARTPGTVEFMSGKLRFYEAALAGVKNRVFEVEYSVRDKEKLDMLRIAVRPLGE